MTIDSGFMTNPNYIQFNAILSNSFKYFNVNKCTFHRNINRIEIIIDSYTRNQLKKYHLTVLDHQQWFYYILRRRKSVEICNVFN